MQSLRPSPTTTATATTTMSAVIVNEIDCLCLFDGFKSVHFSLLCSMSFGIAVFLSAPLSWLLSTHFVIAFRNRACSCICLDGCCSINVSTEKGGCGIDCVNQLIQTTKGLFVSPLLLSLISSSAPLLSLLA